MCSVDVGEAIPWFTYIANYLAYYVLSNFEIRVHAKAFYNKVSDLFWDDPLLYNRCSDGVIWSCVPKVEVPSILSHFHSQTSGGHFGVHNTVAQIHTCGFFRPTIHKDVDNVIWFCNASQQLEAFLGGMRYPKTTS